MPLSAPEKKSLGKPSNANDVLTDYSTAGTVDVLDLNGKSITAAIEDTSPAIFYEDFANYVVEFFNVLAGAIEDVVPSLE